MKLKLSVVTAAVILLLFTNPGLRVTGKSWGSAENKDGMSLYASQVTKYPELGEDEQNTAGKDEDILFECAKRINTVYACKHFLQRFPETGHKQEILDLVARLKQARHPAMRNVDTVSLQIETSFPSGYEFPFEQKGLTSVSVMDRIISIFNGVSIQIITDDTCRADAVLRMRIKGEALKDWYAGANDYQYSGAIVTGEIALEKDGERLFSKSFSSKTVPPQTIQFYFPSAASAPIYLTFLHTGFYAILNQLVNEACQLTPRLQWIFQTRGEVASPAVSDGTVYSNSTDGYLYVLDAGTGTLKWKAGNRGGGERPSIADGIVYYYSPFAHSVHAVNASDRTPVWQFEAKGGVGSLAIHNGTVYSGDNWLYALDAKTGTLKWKVIAAQMNDCPEVYNDVVYYTRDNSVHALDAQDGKKLWEFKTSGSTHSSPEVENGSVYAGSRDHYVYALNADDGSLKWKFKTGYDIYNSPEVHEDVVYVGPYEPWFYALDAETGTLIWKYEIEGNVSSKPVVGDKTLYFVSEVGYLYAIDAASGLLKWKFMTGDDGLPSPTVEGGKIYLGSKRHVVYALDILGKE